MSTSKRQKSSVQAQISLVEALEHSLLRDGADLNPIVDLVKLIDPSTKDPKVVHAALYALHRCFSSLVRQGRIHGQLNKADDAAAVVKEWLKLRWTEYCDALIQTLHCENSTLTLSALSIIMDLVRIESDLITAAHMKQSSKSIAPLFASSLFSKLCDGILQPSQNGTHTNSEVKSVFVSRYIADYDDVRFHFLREFVTFCTTIERSNKTPPLHFVSNSYSILESIKSIPSSTDTIKRFLGGSNFSSATKNKSGPPKAKKARLSKDDDSDDDKDDEDKSTGIFDDKHSSSSESESEKSSKPALKTKNKTKNKDVLSAIAHRKAFDNAWLYMLPLLRDDKDIKRTLNNLHGDILPNMNNPKLLMDWLVDCCDKDGTIPFLALNGLFILMTQHNLDYPMFYDRVYALVDRQILHFRYRARFLRLLSTFLSSTHLPSVLVAAFVKKLARLCLCAPVSAVVAVLPFIYNLLKLHPTCMVLIHRNSDMQQINEQEEQEDENEGEQIYVHSQRSIKDMFNFTEPDPLKSNALESSLWELAALRKHASASVATLAKIFQEQMSKPSYNLEDFLDHTYTTLFTTEANRKMKNPPALAEPLPPTDLLV